MSLQVYNTLSRAKEKFEPHSPPRVLMYCCGPTVYGLLHVGNFRGAIFFNLVRNWLQYLDYKVTFIYNYTDVDDKIIQRAKEENLSAKDLAEKYITEFQKDFSSLKLKPHSANPRVSETIPEIISLIQDLIQKNVAYVSNRGDVWYSIRNFPSYGKLSNRNTEQLLEAVRIEKEDGKKDPLDFALWKSAKPEEPSWLSPWGAGRPGWHIECSAMAKKHLADQIDIHGGGLDLIFPHHENEIAQTEGSTRHVFAKYWMHNNLINFSGAKMSKSLGNIITARSFMQKYNPEILKYITLSSHYRSVMDLSEENIHLAIKGLARIYSALSLAESVLQQVPANTDDSEFKKSTDVAWKGIEQALNDDFNTPEAFARIFEVVRLFNAQVKFGIKANEMAAKKAKTLREFILKFGQFISLFQEPAHQYLCSLDDMLLLQLNLNRADIDKIVQERWQARLNKDFKTSDQLRDKLLQMGISVMDSAEGSFWEVQK